MSPGGERARGGRLVVLLGPPGSGKSFLAECFARRFDLDYVEHEALLVRRWGTVERFVANKAEALAEIERDLVERLGRGDRPVVFETTGLSDRPMLERLMKVNDVLFVHVVAPPELCVQRVRTRPLGRHLVDDAEAAGRFNDFWAREVAPSWRCDVEARNDRDDPDGGSAALIALIGSALLARWPGAGWRTTRA